MSVHFDRVNGSSKSNSLVYLTWQFPETVGWRPQMKKLKSRRTRQFLFFIFIEVPLLMCSGGNRLLFFVGSLIQ